MEFCIKYSCSCEHVILAAETFLLKDVNQEDGSKVGGSGAQFSLCPAGTASRSSEEQSE